MTCAECDRPINIEADHYFADGTPPFWVCRDCSDAENKNWAQFKADMKAEGVNVDECTFIEDVLSKDD